MDDRTQKIPIVDASNEVGTFSLGSVQPAHSASEAIKAQQSNPSKPQQGISSKAPIFPDSKISKTSPSLLHSSNPSAANSGHVTTGPRSSRLTYRIWSALEFVAVTAALFMIFFFILNWQSYSQLFQTKLDLLKGTLNSNPYLAQQAQDIKNASPEGQQPLPIVQNPVAAKKQIPDLNIDIAPVDDRVLIPRIGQNVPIVQVPTDKLIQKDWAALESQIQDALRHGVVHFPGTAYPGQDGNVVITGHSSYFPWDPGRFKDVFALLHQVNIGDEVIVYHDQVKYKYIVYDKKVVKPSEVDVLTQEGENRLTLITCTPVGTALNRLVILAHPETT